ncbi:MAG: aminodeoxychorismate synthase component I [Dehalogenimonas sp.]|uniref:aminodeoxychorismate synthase n=1 Tax=Candidatus Dehalogenimonas loeffleri TaxID=3127115 RepID=A0ABZ2J5B6_9CHLR|nr:aminodeoxychorismate synthase component I [Dehalogenimonas sp.]
MTQRRQPLIEEWNPGIDPADIFQILSGDPGVFYLDSALTSDRQSRYSFIGSRPFALITSRGRRISVSRNNQLIEHRQGNPFDEIGRVLKTFALEAPDSPVPFCSGAVGYFGYDAGRQLEKIPRRTVNDLKLPECRFGLYDLVYAYDHREQRGYIISNGFPETDEAGRTQAARERAAEFKRRISSVITPCSTNLSVPAIPRIESNFSYEDYLATVARARDYIISGDIFEVNLSQRFTVELKIPPAELYQRLRRINPAPFATYLDGGGFSVVSSSPERFIKLSGNTVETRPIKGTRRRGENAAEDAIISAELLASEKDRAENMMIVDLERNDLGRVCCYGSVSVTDLAVLETFPSVFHLTSSVTGRLRADQNGISLLKAAFPGGSITGAPKVRAMEIIEELEPHRRGIYTGAIGYLGFNGDMDLNIAIRTIVTRKNQAFFQTGGAVTYDSDPETEYQETRHKAWAMFQALGASDE